MGDRYHRIQGWRTKLYLSPILDLFNGEIVAWETACRPTEELVKRMLNKGLESLAEGEKPLLHSDSNNADVSLYHHLVCRLTRLV